LNTGGFSSDSGTVAASPLAASRARSVCSVSCNEVIPVVVSIRRASSDGCRRGAVTRAAVPGAPEGDFAVTPRPAFAGAFLLRPTPGASGGATPTAFGAGSGKSSRTRAIANSPHALPCTWRANASAQYSSARGLEAWGSASGSAKRKCSGVPLHACGR
jgi:hypothetical protein